MKRVVCNLAFVRVRVSCWPATMKKCSTLSFVGSRAGPEEDARLFFETRNFAFHKQPQ